MTARVALWCTFACLTATTVGVVADTMLQSPGPAPAAPAAMAVSAPAVSTGSTTTFGSLTTGIDETRLPDPPPPTTPITAPPTTRPTTTTTRPRPRPTVTAATVTPSSTIAAAAGSCGGWPYTACIPPVGSRARWACVISRESGGNPRAVEPHTGAGGLFQITPATAAGLGFPAHQQYEPIAEQIRAATTLYSQRGFQPWTLSDGC